MGFIALGVFLTLELGSVGDSLEFFMFEFAHIVIFFTTLIFVMQVRTACRFLRLLYTVLIFFSLHCSINSRGYHQDCSCGSSG